VCDVDVIGVPSKLRLIRKTAALTRVSPTLDLRCEENTTRWKWNWTLLCCATLTPEATKKKSVPRGVCRNESLTNSLCNLPDVLEIVGIKEITLGGLLL